MRPRLDARQRFLRHAGLMMLLAMSPLTATQCSPAGGQEEDRAEKVRGVVISTHGSGRDWGWNAMGRTMEDIRAVGANWVSTHPYGGVRADGSVRFRDFDPDDPPAHLVHPIREAHRLGLQILIKPHLAYWGSPFAWRGEIEFQTQEQWSRFWGDYERWIVKLARACRDADGFVVGTELDRTLEHVESWRRIIARVRQETGAPLTYAANWANYQRVPFWRELDVIGIQAYFPLTEEPSPDTALLQSGWRERMAELRRYSGRLERRIVFTELGYNRSFRAAERPWDPRVDGPEAEPFQADCLKIALRAVEAEPAVVGVFLWKWFPRPYPVGRNFQLATPRIKDTIAEVWN